MRRRPAAVSKDVRRQGHRAGGAALPAVARARQEPQDVQGRRRAAAQVLLARAGAAAPRGGGPDADRRLLLAVADDPDRQQQARSGAGVQHAGRVPAVPRGPGLRDVRGHSGGQLRGGLAAGRNRDGATAEAHAGTPGPRREGGRLGAPQVGIYIYRFQLSFTESEPIPLHFHCYIPIETFKIGTRQ